MWLPHGLAAGTTAQQIKDQMWFCQYADPYDWKSKCSEVPFTLEIANKGQLLMTVPTLKVREHFYLKVSGNAGDRIVNDGYGLPLEGSEVYFFTQEPSSDINMPALSSGRAVSLLHCACRDYCQQLHANMLVEGGQGHSDTVFAFLLHLCLFVVNNMYMYWQLVVTNMSRGTFSELSALKTQQPDN